MISRSVLAVLLTLACTQVQAAIVLDGKLDEPEWQGAQTLSGFKVTDPYTQAAPPLKTTVLVHADATGLYIGFICDQPPDVPRVRTHGGRDQFLNSDRVNVMIDFEGTGATGYEFTAFLGGEEKMDAIISRQQNYNYDWDGEWNYAVRETADQWFVEYRIPWSVAPLGPARGGKRTIGIFVSRVVTAIGLRFSQPANAFNRATFVADMQKVEIAAFDKAQLDVYPYGAEGYDFLGKRAHGRAGVDVFWKPSSSQQLTATLNPDFGQVESDQIVVNFSAVPTFFPDKRPFFTENLGLFNTDVNILYTRRIGGPPDCTPAPCSPAEVPTDIRGAAKYTGASGSLAYGAIAAWEDDTNGAPGRSFYIGRVREKLSDSFTIGWIGTHTDRPTLLRQADVNSIDTTWTLSPGVTLQAQGVLSEVDQSTPTFFDPGGTGTGARVTLGYAPGGPLENTTILVAKSQEYNVNDAGYQQRPSENVIQDIATYYWRGWEAGSALQQTSLTGNLVGHVNDSGDRLPTTFIGNFDFVRRDTRSGGLEYDLLNAGGEDDIVTCGGNPFDPGCGHTPAKLPVRHQGYAYWGGAKTGLFRYVVVIGTGTGYYQSHGWYYTRVEPGFYPTDKLFFTSVAAFTQSPDEIISLTGGPVLGTFEYEQQDVSLDANWFPAPQHSLRVKFQWSAYTLDPIQAYRPDASAHLQATNDPLFAVSKTTTALQVRYRWEFAPQSELFIVYTHGGLDQPLEAERNMGSSFRRGFADETQSRFLVKVRYRFALL